jgi:hypothetical protein
MAAALQVLNDASDIMLAANPSSNASSSGSSSCVYLGENATGSLLADEPCHVTAPQMLAAPTAGAVSVAGCDGHWLRDCHGKAHVCRFDLL